MLYYNILYQEDPSVYLASWGPQSRNNANLGPGKAVPAQPVCSQTRKGTAETGQEQYLSQGSHAKTTVGASM